MAQPVLVKNLLLIPLILLTLPPAYGSHPFTCAGNSIVADAVRTTKDIQTFVQCRVGPDLAR